LARHHARRVDPRALEHAQWLPRGHARRIVASLRSYLLRRLPWTEYSVYRTFVEATGLFDRYHVLAGEDAIYGDAVWMESQFEEWDAAAVFGRESGFCFSVVQSATRIPPERVRAKVEPHLRVRAE
ncbi:MAG: hypothetical protein KY396_04515, partial [Actinobacteria bacterium]|nr:hypothetical protein [Actinomycetota bacterium]